MNFKRLLVSVAALAIMGLQAQAFDNHGRGGGHYGYGRGGRYYGGSRIYFDGGFYPYYASPYYDPYYYGYYPPPPVYQSYDDEGEYHTAYHGSSGHRYPVEVDLEIALAKKGYYRGDIDGIIGPEARSSIRRYQRDHGLDVTGRINYSLLKSLGLGRED